MCKWGTDVLLYVPISQDLSYTEKTRWDWKGIDSCIADIVQALNDAGIYTNNSCCGHDKDIGRIDLQDGRTIFILGNTDG